MIRIGDVTTDAPEHDGCTSKIELEECTCRSWNVCVSVHRTAWAETELPVVSCLAADFKYNLLQSEPAQEPN